jgi:Cys-tRNA(Pro)/Cys-tRNA(Cys) deacylase
VDLFSTTGQGLGAVVRVRVHSRIRPSSMTPAINAANKAGVVYRIHEYEHDPNAESYGLEAAAKLGVDPARVFKTLIAELDGGKLACGIVPVATSLNLKAFASACNAKRAEMADMQAAERATGYVAGGISPLGQKKRLLTVVDASARNLVTIFVSAGKRGLEIELAPADLLQLTGGTLAPIARG